jgi:acetylornithine/N-succinyldiaminopimelate aminotransferase
MNTEEKLNQYVLHSYGRYPMAAVRGEGSRLWDSTGKCYLDFCAGIATCVLGHCHPAVTQALQKQAATLVHCSNLYQIPQQADLAEFIVTKCVERPGKVFFSNSGAESNDGLIKVAATATGSPRRTASPVMKYLRSTNPSTEERWAACPPRGRIKSR